jgi:hypothetical protein
MKDLFQILILIGILILLVIYYLATIQYETFFTSPGVFDQLASTEAFGMSPGTLDQLASTRVVYSRY